MESQLQLLYNIGFNPTYATKTLYYKVPYNTYAFTYNMTKARGDKKTEPWILKPF